MKILIMLACGIICTHGRFIPATVSILGRKDMESV
jgi:hypothetical protein